MSNEYDQNTQSLESAEKTHIPDVEPKKESSGGILGMFGFGKKKEEVHSENAFSSEAPEKVEATQIEHESSGLDLIGSKEDGVKPGSAFSSEPAEKEVEHESTGRGLYGSKDDGVKSASPYSSDISESAEKVHLTEPVEPKHESLAETGSVDSTDRGLFGFGGKKAEEVRSEDKFSSEAGERDVEPNHESFLDQTNQSDQERAVDRSPQAATESTDRGLFGFGGKKKDEVTSENAFNSESEQNLPVSESAEPKHESLLEQMHRSDQERSDDRSAEAADRPNELSTESTDRGLFGFGGKKKDDVTSENAFNSEYNQKLPVSESSEPKHESVLEELHLSDPERSEQAANHEALNSQFEEQVRVSKDEPESTDRGLFGLGGKKKDEVTSEDAFNSEFEQKAQVSEYEPKTESNKLHRSGSSSSSSSDEEEVAEGGLKKKKPLKEKIKDKIKGTDKKPEEAVYHQEDNSMSSIPVDHEKYNEVPLPVHQVQPEEKKGFMEKMKDKLPGHKKSDEFTPTPAAVAPPPAAVDHGPLSPPEEKKGFLSKIKDKLHHSKTDEEKEIEKERNQY